jgi:hypothetical protein
MLGEGIRNSARNEFWLQLLCNEIFAGNPFRIKYERLRTVCKSQIANQLTPGNTLWGRGVSYLGVDSASLR